MLSIQLVTFINFRCQKKKQRAAVDFSTVSKGTSAVGKSRGTLKQALFSQGVSDKNGTFEVGLINFVFA